MSEIIQLYSDKDKKIKAYPKTLANEVYMDDGITNISTEVDNKIKEVKSQLDNIERQKYDSISIKNYVNRILNNEINSGCLSFIGDSFSAHGLVDDVSKNYINIINEQIKKITNFGNGISAHPLVTNFQDASFYGLTIDGNISYGSKGACKKSLTLQANSKITLTKDFSYLDVLIENGSVGTLEFRSGGVVYRTINCNNKQGFTFLIDGFIDIPNGDVEIKCVNGNVEISALTRINKTTSEKSLYVNRVAVSGTTTDYWQDNLDNIYNTISFGVGNKGIVVLALGTNNIYSPEATSSQKYYDDLKKMALYFMSKELYVVLVCPPHSNENIFPAKIEPHLNYKNKVLNLSKELNLPFINLDCLNLVQTMDDGVHPNDVGNRDMFTEYKNTLGIPSFTSQKIIQVVNEDFKRINTYQNGWNYFVSSEYGVAYRKINDVVYLQGLCSGGVTSENTIIFTLPTSYRPRYDKFIVVSSSHNPATISIRSNGEVICRKNIDNTFISFDNINFSLI